MERTEFDNLKVKTINECESRKAEIFNEIEYALVHWHTPKHGLRSREELESFQSYRELIESKRLMENDLIKPAEDLVYEDGRVRVRNLWFYKKWDLIKEWEGEENYDE